MEGMPTRKKDTPMKRMPTRKKYTPNGRNAN
jgi:hypothetical protein